MKIKGNISKEYI